MAKLNPNLIRSMIWDLQEIVTVAEEIKSRVGHIECMSWRYPSKRCDSIDVLAILDQHLGPPGEHYIKILELLYDRLLFLFNLLVKFFDIMPVQSAARKMVRPQNISFAAIVHVCWNRLLTVQDTLLHQMVTNITKEKRVSGGRAGGDISHDIVCRGTQTSECSLTTCENCNIAEQLVRSLIQEIETQSKRFGVTSAVVEERIRMKEDLHHVSQWSAMHRWVDAIIIDTNKMIQEIEYVGTLNASLRKEINDNELDKGKEILKYQDRMKTIEEENSQLRQEARIQEANYKTVLKEKENLELTISKSNFEMAKWKKESNKSESVIQEHKSRIKVLESEREKTTRRLAHLEKLEATWEQESKVRDTEVGREKEEREAAERKVSELRQELDTCNARLDELNTDHETERERLLSEKLGLDEQLAIQRKLNAELEERNKNLEDAEKSATAKYQQANAMLVRSEKDLKRSKLQQTVLLEYPDLNGPLNCKVNVKGNPIKDMECQHQANQLRIELLQAQNVKLMRTIKKLKHHSKKTGDVSSSKEK